MDHIVKVIREIDGYNISQKEALCDNIYKLQPHIFQTVINLTHSGIPLPKLDHLLHILMVVHTAFEKQECIITQTIPLSEVEHAFVNLSSMLKYLEAEPDKSMWDLTITSYSEQELLAFVSGYLREKYIITEADEDALVVAMAKVILDTYIQASKYASS